MSLINDALQRAKEVQQTQPSERGSLLQFRPVEPGPETKRSSTAIVSVIVGLVLVLGAVFGFRLFSTGTPETPTAQRVAARVPSVATPASTETPVSTPAARPAAVSPAIATSVPATNEPAVTGTPVLSAKAPLPKLQAIVFSSTRPSAIINGRTLFVGSRIAGFRVGAIQPNSATLVSDTETNVLQLGEE